MVRGELARIAEHGISPDELRRGQGQLRGGLVLSLEDSGSRMSRIAKAELLYDELPSIDEVLQRVADVTLDGRERAGPRAVHPAADAGRGRPVRHAARLSLVQ